MPVAALGWLDGAGTRTFPSLLPGSPFFQRILNFLPLGQAIELSIGNTTVMEKHVGPLAGRDDAETFVVDEFLDSADRHSTSPHAWTDSLRADRERFTATFRRHHPGW